MKNLSKIFGIIILALFFISCSSKCSECLQPTSSKVQTVEVKVPVACELPKIECDFSGNAFVPTQKLLECIIIQKKLLKKCSEPIETK